MIVANDTIRFAIRITHPRRVPTTDTAANEHLCAERPMLAHRMADIRR